MAKWSVVRSILRLRSAGLGVGLIALNVVLVMLVVLAISERGYSGWWDTVQGNYIETQRG